MRLLYLVLSFWTVAVNAQKLYVVSVGIADYAEINDLRFTENDVVSINKVLKKHTKEVYTLLGVNATHEKVIATLKQVFGQAGKDDAVLLFFSGHGYPGGFCCYDMANKSLQNGLSYQELQSIFKSCNAGRKMVFADACFSGGMRTNSNANSQTQSVRNGDVMFFLSSRTNETSQEMIKGPNGQFTRFLVRGLGGGADANKDKIITAKELYDFVHKGVIAATANQQHPVMWGKFDNTMTILNWNKER